MTLLHHAQNHIGQCLGLRGDCKPLVDLIIESAPAAPYVLDQLLALSALHLHSFIISARSNSSAESTQRFDTSRPDHDAEDISDKGDFHSHQATKLQTRALATFNSGAHDQISGPSSKHLPAFVFTVLLGHHLLYTTLTSAAPSNQAQATLADFLPEFLHYVRVHRGVRSVTGLHWRSILDSKLAPLLYLSKQMPSPESLNTGPETEALGRFLQRGEEATTPGVGSGLNPEPVSGNGGNGSTSDSGHIPTESPCLQALQWAQWLVSMIQCNPADDHGQPSDVLIQAIVAWPLVVPQAYVDALYHRQPEALLVLAFYAAALHHCRGFWVFGGRNSQAGSALVDMIGRHVGPAWEECMIWPREAVHKG